MANAEIGPIKSLLGFLNPVTQVFAVPPLVNSMVAISPGNGELGVKEGDVSSDSFTLNLDKGKPYVILLMDDANVVGVYNSDDLDALPIDNNAGDINLGTISVDGNGNATGSVSKAELLQHLGMNSEIATVVGLMDNGMARFANVDVDGNGVLDYKEGKYFDLAIGYQFRGDSFASLVPGQWCDKAAMNYDGYMYYFGFSPAERTPAGNEINWDFAQLHSPADINGVNDILQCYNRDDRPGEDSRMLNFYCGSHGFSPLTPPAGDYTITTSADATFPNGNATFTSGKVRSQLIDANMNNVYFPVIRLTKDSGDHITRIEWQWRERLNDGANYVQPNDHELAAVMNEIWGDLVFEIVADGFNSSVEARTFDITSTGSLDVSPGFCSDPASLQFF